MATADEAMINVLRRVNKLDYRGKSTTATNPQLVLAARESRVRTGRFNARVALNIFNGLAERDSREIAQAQPGIMTRRTVSIF